MRPIHVMHVVGARPNFMKLTPVYAHLAQSPGVRQSVIHTGQHYDDKMSEVFFRELGIPRPDINLEVGSGSHAQQTAQIISRFESAVLELRPDLVFVYGDVNSTLGAALVCAKLLIPVGHIEAGLRSFDLTMPEEINRLVTDRLSEILFTPSADGNENLIREGVAPEKIHFVGNVMIDTLIQLLPKAVTKWSGELLGQWRDRKYALVTLHRPSNVDSANSLRNIARALSKVAGQVPILFPVHPRTRERLNDLGVTFSNGAVCLVDPLGYLDFLALLSRATMVITDSGGIQEETTYLRVPCLTLRENTERPVTVTIGTNMLIGNDLDRLASEARRILDGDWKKGQIPPLWDGNAGRRIAQVVCSKNSIGHES